MEKAFNLAIRPGNLALSVLAFAGLTLLAAQLWTVASGYVILLFIPALLICFYQMAVSPEVGLRLDAQRWRILTEKGDHEVSKDEIAYLRITGQGQVSRAALVLHDGSEVGIPFDLVPDPVDLIHAANQLGVPVRNG